MNRETLLQQYDKIYQALNEDQKNAVDQIYGPVLVLAGPGTGKTQILSARIGKILLEADYMPENILCLTYTDAGRVAMRSRLLDMIGADAYRVAIHTFHSFCSKVIQDNVMHFNKASMEPVSDIEKVEIIREIIDEFEPNNPLKRYKSSAYFDLVKLQNLYATMKKEGWTVSYLIEAIDRYEISLPERPGFTAKRKHTAKDGKVYNAGDARTDKIEAEINRMLSIRAAIKTFDKFDEKMQARGLYDFDDMINWVNQLFASNSDVLANYQEQFQFVLVDEFQDTSGAQNNLLDHLISGDSTPNIFAVGDDDQSIYRFQGANVENILSFKKQYADTLTQIVLQKNYRSTQIILDASAAVIENNTQRLCNTDPKLNKNIIAANTQRLQIQIAPQLRCYKNPFQEMASITQEIYQLIHTHQIPANEIAVIYTHNAIGKEMMQFLKSKHIPFYAKNTENLFELTLSRKLLTILQYIVAETTMPYSGDSLLFEILHFDIYQIPANAIAIASIRANEYNYKQKSKSASFRSFINYTSQQNQQTLFDQPIHPNIHELNLLLEKWISDSYNLSVLQLINNILHEGRFVLHALNTEDKLWNLDILRAFMDFAKEEMHRKPNHTIQTFLQVIEVMENQRISIPLHRSYGNENGVNLLTAHGSKGLEFRYVFLIQTHTKQWEENKPSANNNYFLPDTVWKGHLQVADELLTLEEKRRLFFVAMTRAMEHLNISWAENDMNSKKNTPSKFIAEITEKIQLEKQQISLSPELVEAYLPVYIHKDKKPVLEPFDHDMLDTIISRFEMSVTALNNFLACPVSFYYNNLLRVPASQSEYLVYGTSIHFALERLFVRREENNKQFPSLEVFVKDFEWKMYHNREVFSKENYTRYLEFGQKILPQFYQVYLPQWENVELISVEKNFNNIFIDGIPIKGKLDKIVHDFSNITVVDYKTGNLKNNMAKLKPPTAAEPNGGDYWRQAVFYKILAESDRGKNYRVLHTTFQSVEPSDDYKFNKYTVVPTDEDVAIVKKQIKETWHRIQSKDFYTGCGKDDCKWCNFIKDNHHYIDLKEADPNIEPDNSSDTQP